MANPKTLRKQAVLPVDEQVLADQIEKLAAVEKPNDQQKAILKTARSQLGGKRFVRIANKRVPKTLKAIATIANLAGAGYSKSPAQVKAICDALRGAVDQVEQRLSGTKQESAGFTLPIA